MRVQKARSLPSSVSQPAAVFCHCRSTYTNSTGSVKVVPFQTAVTFPAAVLTRESKDTSKSQEACLLDTGMKPAG